MILEARAVAFRYDDREVLAGIDLALHAGEVVGLVGANGAGKSTLLRVLAGLRAPSAGGVWLDGAPIARLDRREAARRIALLPQSVSIELPFTVREIVAMGRTPHVGRFAPLAPADRDAIDEAMRAADVAALAARPITEISDGERQRCLLARAFAQRAGVLLLDEPTASLDLRHAFTLMRAVRERVARGGAALAAMHDLGLAARTCDRIVVLAAGRVIADGPPSRALAPEVLARALGLRTTLVEGADGAPSIAVLGVEE